MSIKMTAGNSSSQTVKTRAARIQYLFGWMHGRWQYKYRPRLNVQYLRGYLCGRLKRLLGSS